VLVLLLSDLRVVWRSEIYRLTALLSAFWFHKCCSYMDWAAPTIVSFLSFSLYFSCYRIWCWQFWCRIGLAWSGLFCVEFHFVKFAVDVALTHW
jgi:hypothetical protein